MPKDKRSFFERLTGSLPDIESEEKEINFEREQKEHEHKHSLPQASDEGQLLIDVHHTPDEIIIQSVVAGVKPEDLDVAITQDMVTIRGCRGRNKEIPKEDYFYQELYWGSFARSILLPQEIDVEAAEANLKNGLLAIRLPKIDKTRVQKLKIRQE